MVTVVTDRKRFIDEMVKRGVKVREDDLLEVQDTDFAVTARGLTTYFVGGDVKLKPVASEVLDMLRQENPSFIARRKRGTHNDILVVTELGRGRFIDEMVRQGAKVRETER